MLTLPSSFLISKVTNDTAFQVYQCGFFLRQTGCVLQRPLQCTFHTTCTEQGEEHHICYYDD